MKPIIHRYAILSLVSTLATGFLTTVHHAYELGFLALVQVLVAIVLPYLSMRWFKQTGSTVALWLYGLLTAWLVFGFGMVDGLWNHTMKSLGSYMKTVVLSVHGPMSSGGAPAVDPAVAGNLIYQGTGILTFIASVFAAYYGYKFIQESRQSRFADTKEIGG